MEHLNRMCKLAVANLGASKTPNALERVGKSLGVIAKLLLNYDEELHVSSSHGGHSDKDKRIVIQELLDN